MVGNAHPTILTGIRMIAETRLAGRAGAVTHALNVHASGERLARDGMHGVPVGTKRMDAAGGRFTLWLS